ncbi:restriction endonuclease subunit S [Lysinibacillus sp. NPDC097231]|uniref:restriction endonuclease subunit S n=1 Tax=Lysinibacillus sp. NPDC097231 TaxID=3364142 RepID=UPI00381FB007
MRKRYRLGEVAKIEVGNIVPEKKPFTKVGLPFITAKNLKQLMLDNNIHQLPKINGAFKKHFMCTTVPAKTILLTKTKDTNKHVYQCKNEVFIANDIVAIIPNESVILSDYLFHFLKWYPINKECNYLDSITLNIPMIDIQYKMVQLLNMIQLLLKNKDSLMTALDGLPQHSDHLFMQIENHATNLQAGFNGVQYLYNEMLHKIFKGELYTEMQELELLKNYQ